MTEIYFRPSEYFIEGLSNHPRATITRRSTSEENAWAICDAGFCLNKDGKWEWEPSPSNRDEAFIERTRFHLQDAFEIVIKVFGNVDKKEDAPT